MSDLNRATSPLKASPFMSPIATRVSEHRRSHEPTLHKPNLTRRRDKLPFADVSPAVLDPLDPVVNEPFSERGPSGEYKVLEQPLGMRRKLKVICIGAGPSGINMAWVTHPFPN